MTTPAPLWMHNHVSERELAHTWPDGQKDDGHWEDCLWCSVVEWLNDTYKDVPDTLAYAEKLRDASGEPPSGGSNFGDVQRAFTKLGIPIIVHPLAFAAFWTALKPGTGAVATGNMGYFPAGHHLRRWDPSFAAGHAVEVSRVDSTDRVWWCDPLATDTGYNGEFITKAQLKQFMGGWTGSTPRALRKQPAPAPAPTPAPTGDDMPQLTTYTPGVKANVKALSNIRSAPKIAATKYRMVPSGTKEPVVLTGTVSGDKDPANGSTVWYVWWKNGRWEYTAKDNVVDLTAPAVDDGYTATTQAAAVKAATDPLNARIATIKGKVAANAADIAND